MENEVRLDMAVEYMKLQEAAIARIQELEAERDAARAEASELREQVAWMRAIAQAALDYGGDLELVYAPLYQQALEDIASEVQDDDDRGILDTILGEHDPDTCEFCQAEAALALGNQQAQEDIASA